MLADGTYYRPQLETLKFSGSRVRQRGSSPKLLALNTALISATSG